MKTAKKLFAVLLAAIMVMALAITAWAAPGDNTITIENATPGNTYTVYKVFDAKGDGTGENGAIVYTVMASKDGEALPNCFEVDEATGTIKYTGDGTNNQLTADDIAAIAGYVEGDTPVASATAAGDDPTVPTSVTVDVSAYGYGYYYITTTTGTAVTVTSTNPNATVTDKNEAPELDKNITAVDGETLDEAGKDALAQIGSTVDYKVTIDVKKGAYYYVFHDVMADGLTYNNDIKVTVDGTEIPAGTNTYDNTTAEGDTITLTFDNAWIAEQVDKTITITYSATINKNALNIDHAKNTASLGYGDNNTTNYTEVAPPTVHTASVIVTKQDGDGKPLAGAGFVLSKEGDTPGSVVYYKKDADTGAISWVESMDEATELVTTEEDGGNVLTFDGLGAGTYTLVEKTVPDGYNEAADEASVAAMTIVVSNADLTDESVTTVEKSVTVTNNAGSILPSTGGIGTTIFYVVGGVLVAAAIVLLVTRKRMNNAD